MAQGYFAKGYFKEDYWNDNFWAPTGSQGGRYWNQFVWNDNYWNQNYWKTPNVGDVFQNEAAELDLTPYNPTVSIGLNVEPDTEALPLVAFQADANLDIDPPLTVEALSLTSYAASVVIGGYQASDIDLRFVPDSGITVTYGVVTDLEALNLAPMVHTVEVEGGVNVAASVASLSLNVLQHNARLDIAVEPLPPSLTLTDYDVTAGIGTQVPVTLGALTLSEPTHTIEGTEGLADAFPDTVPITLNALRASVLGIQQPSIPIPTFAGDLTILNADADEYPSNYEICDRTGFKLERGNLRREWTGAMVRPESWERRNIQDFVRGVGDDQRGSPRPEQSDRFITEEYPDGVSAEDL